MKLKVNIEGQNIEIEIPEQELNKLKQNQDKETGYERVGERCDYYYDCLKGRINCTTDFKNKYDIELFNAANYYSDETVANNNMRADRLMRQLRRFAVEHRKRDIKWGSNTQFKYQIIFNYDENMLKTLNDLCSKRFGAICFDSEETARLAIEEFHDELIWYFTEYKDSL